MFCKQAWQEMKKEVTICTECQYKWPQYKNSQVKCKGGELIYFISDTEHKPFNGKCSQCKLVRIGFKKGGK